MNGKVNVVMVEDFPVLDLNGVRKPAIPLTEFTATLYNPSGVEVSGTIPVTIVELANGDYRASYTPTIKGLWTLTVFHATYFSAGKTNSHQIYDSDIDEGTAAKVWQALTGSYQAPGTMGEIMRVVLAHVGGRLKINSTTKQAILYDTDNSTELLRFDLYDFTGTANIRNIADRQRV